MTSHIENLIGLPRIAINVVTRIIKTWYLSDEHLVCQLEFPLFHHRIPAASAASEPLENVVLELYIWNQLACNMGRCNRNQTGSRFTVQSSRFFLTLNREP